MVLTLSKTSNVRVVRVRETQEYDIEVLTFGSDHETAKLARRKFMGMTVDEQAASSVGVSARRFEVGDDQFDDDELA
jgi:hypothetical protein